jgi:hypothetical protein
MIVIALIDHLFFFIFEFNVISPDFECYFFMPSFSQILMINLSYVNFFCSQSLLILNPPYKINL